MGCIISIVAGSLIIVPASYITAYINDPANRELVILTEYISAGGFHVPLMITFKGAFYLQKFFKNEIDRNILFL